MNGPDIFESSTPDFRAMWETQTHEVSEMTEAQLNHRLKTFKRGLLIRKVIGVFAAVVTIKIFVASLIFGHDVLLELGFGLLAGWVCWVAITLWQSAAGHHKSLDACADYFQTLLAEERAYLASGTIWGPVTVLPIAALLFWRILVLLPAEYHSIAWIAGAVCLFGALIKVLFFRWQMHRLGREIAGLNRRA